MKILYCTGAFNTYGASYSAQKEIHGFLEAADDVHVFTFSSSLPDEIKNHDSVAFTTLPRPTSLRHLISYVSISLRLLRERKKWDIIYINALEYAFFLFLPFERVVYYSRTTLLGLMQAESARGWHPTWKKSLLRHILSFFEGRMIRKARLVLCKSSMTAKEVAQQYAREHALHSIPGGVDPVRSAFQAERVEKFVFASRQTPSKGTDLLVAEVAQLGLEVDIFGAFTDLSPRDNRRYREHCITLFHAMNHVTFRGEISHGQLLRELHNCTYFVLSSLYEPFGLTAIEAHFAGCTVFISRYCGSAEILQGKRNIYLYDPLEPGSFTKAFYQARAQKHNQDAKPMVEQHSLSWETVVRSTRTLLLSLPQQT